LRKKIKNLLSLDKTGDAHARLNDLLYSKLKDIVSKGKYGSRDATIKYNALLLFGDLNEVEDPSKPKPWAKPFPMLLSVAQSSKVKDYMKVAALIGIERYAALGAIPPDKQAEVIKEMVALLNQAEPPAGRDATAQQFLRRSAAQILAYVGSPGPDNSVVKALEKVVTDSKARPEFRCEMAQFLGQLKYPPASKVDLQKLANAVGHQAVDVCKQELDAAKTANRAASRRIILYALFSAKEALGGSDGKSGLTAAAAGAPAQKFIGNLYVKLKALQVECESSDTTDDLVDTEILEVTPKLNDLEGLLAPRTPAKPEQLMAAERKKEPAAEAGKQ
jgi:hypothetical protein